MLRVQEALRHSRYTLEDLKYKYGISSRFHKDYPNLVSLKYSMIDSPMGERIVQESRGLILNSVDDWMVVGRGFDKFFNLGERLAVQIDYSTARFQEKADGSLMMLYPYGGGWHVATSGTPDAAGEVNGNPFTFKDLFWKIWGKMGMTLPPPEYNRHNYTFMFELTSPYNRVVVVHPESKLTFLGARCNWTGREYNPTTFLSGIEGFRGWVPVKEYPIRSMDDALASFKDMDPTSQEGYVVVDAEFNRIKVKHPGYLVLHRLKGEGLNPKRIAELICLGETSEILANFPEWKPNFEEMEGRIRALVQELEQAYEIIKNIESQKEFALQAVRCRMPSALFTLRKGNVKCIEQYLYEMNVFNLLQALGYK